MTDYAAAGPGLSRVCFDCSGLVVVLRAVLTAVMQLCTHAVALSFSLSLSLGEKVALVIMQCFGSKSAREWADREAGTRVQRFVVGDGSGCATQKRIY